MKKFKVETIEGNFEVEGTHYSMMKYLVIYNGDKDVFTIRTNKVLKVSE